MKKITSVLLTLILVATLFIPVYGSDSDKIKESKLLENLGVDELIQELNNVS